ncbi:hypothetical protein EDC04DRAFT_2943104 [Pisolithus marmoratus]|nr:hypothetical protein EDC04DRAFT_2943104 [Pisolithus marmoratus]
MDEGESLEYQTTRVISDFNANALRGCGTCIFEVCLKSQDRNLVKDAKPAVLKDCWRDSNQDHKDTILKQIFTSLWNQKGIEEADEARKYFLMVLTVGNVMVDRKIDGTDSLLCTSNLPTDCTWYPLPSDELLKAKATRAGEGLTPSLPYIPGSAKQAKFNHRIHSHLVFEEVCQPMYELQRLDTVFEMLQDAHKGWLSCNVNSS